MSAGVFPPTSSRSTRPRTSYAHAGVRGLCGLHEGTVSQRIGPGILRRRRGRPDRIVGSPGGRGSSPGIGRVPYGRPDRPGPTVRFALSGLHVLPEPATLLSPRASLALSQALASPEPDAALFLKPSSSASRSPSPPCFCPSPASERLLPPSPSSVRSLLRSPGSHPRSARAPWSVENGRSLAAYLARYGEHGSHLRGLMR